MGGVLYKENHPHWSGDDISYKGMHRRLERERGKAADFGCINGCLEASGFEWAHTHGTDPHNVMNYRPMCLGCHRRYDCGGAKQYGAKLTWEQVEEIRALAYFGISQPRLAKMYGVKCHSTIGRIVRVETWKPRNIELETANA